VDHTTHAAIREGDPDAFRRIFHDHAQAVYGHAYRVTRDWAAAEDVVSLTFLEAWRLRERVRDEGESLRPWLMGIAVNVLRNRGRALRRHHAAMRRTPNLTSVPDFADEVVGRITDAHTLASVTAALAKLRRADREVFELCVWSGLSHAEAARALGLAEGTVRSRLSRARQRLYRLTEAESLAAQAAPGDTQRSTATGQRQVGRTASVRAAREVTR